MQALVECLQGTQEKYELVRQAGVTPEFVIQRLLKRKWVANYGFIPGTLQADGDELDAYILGTHLERGVTYDVLPICMIYSIDNGETDNKLICGTTKARRNLRRQVKQIVRFVNKYKKGSLVLKVTWKEENLRYEVAKCKAYKHLFSGFNK